MEHSGVLFDKDEAKHNVPTLKLSLTAAIFQTGDGGRSWAEAHHHKGIRTGIAALTFAAVVNAPLPAMADTFVFNAGRSAG